MVGMGNEVTTRENAGAGTSGGVVVGGFEMVDFSDMGTSDLIKLVLQADVARRQLDGYLAALLGRLGELEGDEAVAAVCSQFGISGHKARKQAKTAGVLQGLPHTLEAAKDGWITMDHAQLMAESHSRAPITLDEELELITLAIKQDYDQFRKTVATSEDKRQAADGMSRTERQRARRFAKVFDGDNDMVVVYAELDRIAGERVKTALESLHSRMLRDDSATGNERTFEQRNADALVALMTQQPAAIRNGQETSSGAGRIGREASELDVAGLAAADSGVADSGEHGCGDLTPQKTVLVVSVDFDALTGKLGNAGLIDGSPIEIDELRRIACDAAIVPAIFGADGQPLYFGKQQRSATQAQRLALYRRDRGCIGCGMRPTACDAHHIKWWDQGGPTDITNLVLLCPRCHDKVHNLGYTVREDSKTGRFVLKPSRGRRVVPRPPPGETGRAPQGQPEGLLGRVA